MSTTAATSRADISVRRAAFGDADAVFRLLTQLGESYTPERDAFDESFRYLVGDAVDTLFLTAVDSTGSVCGYALSTITRLLYTNGRSAQLQELVVDESMRSRGVGTLLIESIESECRLQGVVQLTVPSRRSAGFYERLGYRSTADFLKRTF